MALNSDLLEIFNMRLSTFGESVKVNILKGLEDMIYNCNTQLKEKIINDSLLIEKIINNGYQSSYRIQVGVCRVIIVLAEQVIKIIYFKNE